MSCLVLKELQRKCCLFLKTFSLVMLELFFSSDFLMVFVIHVKATKNSPPPKSVPEYETHSELALLYAKVIPIHVFGTFAGI